ncbi:hypothetical protein D3C79_816330 [compost metagenome]
MNITVERDRDIGGYSRIHHRSDGDRLRSIKIYDYGVIVESGTRGDVTCSVYQLHLHIQCLALGELRQRISPQRAAGRQYGVPILTIVKRYLQVLRCFQRSVQRARYSYR